MRGQYASRKPDPLAGCTGLKANASKAVMKKETLNLSEGTLRSTESNNDHDSSANMVSASWIKQVRGTEKEFC